MTLDVSNWGANLRSNLCDISYLCNMYTFSWHICFVVSLLYQIFLKNVCWHLLGHYIFFCDGRLLQTGKNCWRYIETHLRLSTLVNAIAGTAHRAKDTNL